MRWFCYGRNGLVPTVGEVLTPNILETVRKDNPSFNLFGSEASSLHGGGEVPIAFWWFDVSHVRRLDWTTRHGDVARPTGRKPSKAGTPGSLSCHGISLRSRYLGYLLRSEIPCRWYTKIHSAHRGANQNVDIDTEFCRLRIEEIFVSV